MTHRFTGRRNLHYEFIVVLGDSGHFANKISKVSYKKMQFLESLK